MTTADDREIIRDLYARYCHRIDDPRRYETWVELFTSDAVVTSSVADRVVGYDGLRALTKNMAAYVDTGVQSRHLIDNLSIELNDDRAVTECTVTAFHTVQGRTRLFMIGIYRGLLRKVDGEWLISELNLAVDTDIGRVDSEV